ncbi:MAG: hypothetical protein KAT37_02640 [Candidatus Aenigmarchaeota archaeon]|nr:hypothetical protein [Candidatus Aenigmarchaeota archaeon]
MSGGDISQKLINTLGDAGLPERLDKSTFKEGVKYADKLIELVKGIRPKRVQGVMDDFLPDTALYNALGAIYSGLTPDSKKDALNAYITQFDHVNYFYIQINHTPYIREPLVLADVFVENALYWPSLDEGKKLVKEYNNFANFKEEVMMPDGMFNPKKIDSDFCVAFAALRSDMSQYGPEYTKACHPKFLDRVIEGIVNMRIGRKDPKEGLPQEVHSIIEKMKK